jgi:hypothetical protein
MTGDVTTTNSGAPVASDEFSQTAGNDGVVPLHDHYLGEKLAQCNRERLKSASCTRRAAGLSDLRDHRRRESLHPSQPVPARSEGGDARTLLDRGRGVGECRHRARPRSRGGSTSWVERRSRPAGFSTPTNSNSRVASPPERLRGARHRGSRAPRYRLERTGLRSIAQRQPVSAAACTVAARTRSRRAHGGPRANP